MSTWAWIAVGVGATLLVYAAFVAALLVAGRRTTPGRSPVSCPTGPSSWGGCSAMPRVPRARKLLVPAAIAYLALPFDLVPDMIPVTGALADALVVALVLRLPLRGSGRELVHEHWPGPDPLARAGRAPGRLRVLAAPCEARRTRDLPPAPFERQHRRGFGAARQAFRAMCGRFWSPGDQR